MKIEEFRQNRFVRNFARDQRLIWTSGGVVLLFAIGYVAWAYQPNYQSEAKVWIKDTSRSSYLSMDHEEPGYFSALTQSSNPVMTQSEILTSRTMENFLADFLIQQKRNQANGKKVTDAKPDTHKIVQVKIEPSTDILKVRLGWHDRAMAKALLTATLQKLDETNLAINRQIRTRQRVYIEKQLKAIESQLLAIRDRMKAYQSNSLMVDVNTQTQEMVRLRSQLSAQLETALATKQNSAGNAQSLQRQLALSPKIAINAVALGSGNDNLTKMRTDLAVLQQQYAHDVIKEAPTNPHLVAMKNQIDTLQRQIAQEIKHTVGVVSPNAPLIFDRVRSQMVGDLASSRAKSSALSAEAASLSASIARIDEALKELPSRRFTLAGLEEEERALSLAYDELRKKQIEASIKEAETASNVFVVDPPNLPEKASFPTGVHILLLSALLGLSAGCGLSMLKTYLQDRCEGVTAIEEVTRAAVLGVVPWQEAIGHITPEEMPTILAMNSVAYQHILSNLRLIAYQHHARVITFTSTAFNKARYGGTYYLAKNLSRLGQSVLYIDADFRISPLVQTVSETTLNLTDLILSVDLKMRNGQEISIEDILPAINQTKSGTSVLLNRQNTTHPYEYFANRAFRQLIAVLKEHFDWVFINTSSGCLAPEFLPIANISEGVVVFADKDVTHQALRKISLKIKEARTPFLGTIVREKNDQLEWEHEQYSNWQDPRQGGGGLGHEDEVLTTSDHSPARRVEFMGAKIDALTMQETIQHIISTIEQKKIVQHVVVNVAKLMNMRRDFRLKRIVNNSDIINADGAGIVVGARLLGIQIPERVAGIDLMQHLIEQANERGYRVFFLGAEENVVRDVVAKYRSVYPSLKICGYRNGYFEKDESLSVAQKIAEAKPDILFVGMSSPHKEEFIDAYKTLTNVPFMMGVGGSFDVISGKVQRAPQWMQNAGLEWMFRLLQEPDRLWRRYLVTNLQYGMALTRQAVFAKLRISNG